MKKKNLIPGLALAAILMACNSSSTTESSTDSMATNDDTTSRTDTTSLINTNMDSDTSKMADFLTEAAGGGMMEVQLGQIAKKNAASKAVKDFGAMMVRDHSNANAELKKLAAEKNVTLPAALPEKHQKHIDDLSKKTGADFDKDYISMMVDDHKEDIDAFEKCSKSDKEDADVKAFASKTLPVLHKHLDSAQAIKSRM
jgi:putative membrane protein